VHSDPSRHEVEIDLSDPNTSHSLVVDIVGRGKNVLDVGCGTGDLGRALVERGCRVSGLEVDEAAAELARHGLEQVVVADLNASPASEHFPADSFDAVVFADVLEHLEDPVGALTDAVGLLKPGGRVVASIPNITHGSVRLALLQGRWHYTDVGLLDSTHVRFFNRAGVLELFAAAGLFVEELQGSLADPLDVEVVVAADQLPPSIVEWVRHQRDALVYQYIVGARVARDEATPADVPLVPAVPEDSVRVVDKFTARSEAELETRQQQLNMRDHIIGLEAATATAQARAARAEKQLERVEERLTRKNDRIRALVQQIRELEGEGGDRRSSGRGPLGRLRRGQEQ
jgi:2-polyprenyl-3-methyl-5-hydroxy-6-metoxy-1,4-benzoquinol methylase